MEYNNNFFWLKKWFQYLIWLSASSSKQWLPAAHSPNCLPPICTPQIVTPDFGRNFFLHQTQTQNLSTREKIFQDLAYIWQIVAPDISVHILCVYQWWPQSPILSPNLSRVSDKWLLCCNNKRLVREQDTNCSSLSARYVAHNSLKTAISDGVDGWDWLSSS